MLTYVPAVKTMPVKWHVIDANGKVLGRIATDAAKLMKEVGMKLIHINPILNDTGAVWCDQWVPIIPGTDVAMALAIANVWIKEGTYDKNFIATHAVGFTLWRDPTR